MPPPANTASPSANTTPPPAVSTYTRQLRPRKPQNLTPGAPDLPQVRRTSAEVRAEKEKNEARKEAGAVKTKAARARVEGIKEVLRREEAEIDLPAKGTTQRRSKNAPKTNNRGSKLKAKSNTASLTTEATVRNAVSISIFSCG